jgi:hypothetical protein
MSRENSVGETTREDENPPPPCGHYRHWADGVQDNGTGDWETCDDCGRLTCFDLDCENGWGWTDHGTVRCLRCYNAPTYKEITGR